MTELNWLSLTQIESLKARDEFDAKALLASCLARIAEREAQVQAFEFIEPERIAAPSRPTSLLGAGLEGIPFGVKDLMDTFDMPTGWGSPIYRGRQPRRDAGCVATLRACGALPVGKTVTTEFAYFHPGKTRNPIDLAHTPGGSSQGSAAAVADGMVPLALGTQTAASVIRPAAFCGVVGYKSSRGAFDLGGVCSLSQTLDSLGFFVRDARDLFIVRRAMTHGRGDAAPMAPKRVAMVRTPHWDVAEPAAREAVEQAAERLSRQGVDVEDVAVGPGDGALTQAHKTVMAFEVARSRMDEFTRHRDALSATMIALVESGLAITAREYAEAIGLATSWAQRVEQLFGDYDVLLTPSTAGEAPAGLDSTGDPLFSRMWTLLGLPAVNLPHGRGPRGLPIGIQLIGRHFHDDALLAHAAWVQSVSGDSRSGQA